MLGNAFEWCQEHVGYYTPGPGGMASEDKEDNQELTDDLICVVRGGSFTEQGVLVRSAFRVWDRPTLRSYYVSFRPARTFR
jgi:formylglycine-generating enzyme required for sulfatase activity